VASGDRILMLREYYSASMVRETRFDMMISNRVSIFTFRVRRVAQAKRPILVTAVCVSVCLSVPRRIPTVTLLQCPIVVHYRANLQSVHSFHCYDNIAPNVKCQRVLACTPSMPGFLFLSSHIELRPFAFWLTTELLKLNHVQEYYHYGHQKPCLFMRFVALATRAVARTR